MLILHKCITSPGILNCFKIWSATVMEKHRTAFETIWTKEKRRMQFEELLIPNIIEVTKSVKM